MKIFIDGQFYDEEDAKVSILDHGFLYGNGVFTTLTTYKKRIIFLSDNIERLIESAKIIDIPVMGSDSHPSTAGYCESGDVPEFKLYRPSTGMLNSLSGSIVSWNDKGISITNNIYNSDIPVDVTLEPAYPNPFNPSTSLSYQVPLGSNVELSIFDINGRFIQTLLEKSIESGVHRIAWRPQNISSGIYIVSLRTEMGIKNQKVLYLK